MSRRRGARAPLEDRLAPTLDEVAAAYGAARGVDPETLTLEVVATRARRGGWIIGYRVRPGTGRAPEERLVGKVYPSTEKSETTFHIMRHAWSHGMGTDAELSMPRPLAHLRHRCTVLMTHAPGLPLAACLDQDDGARTLACRAAEWLLRLHRVPAIRDGAALVSRAQADLDRMLADLAVRLPAQAPRITRLGHRLRDLDRRIRWHPRVFLHGDLHPSNLFADSTRLTGIDFDHAGLGDPVWELSYLATHAEILALRVGAAAEQASRLERAHSFGRELIATYLARARDVGPDLAERLARSRALTLLESLHYDVAILHVPRPPVTDAMITEAEASLTAIASTT